MGRLGAAGAAGTISASTFTALHCAGTLAQALKAPKRPLWIF